MTTFAFALGGVSLIGLPPSGGFLAKWLLLEAAVVTGQWWWATVMLAGGLFTAGYMSTAISHALVPAREPLKLARHRAALSGGGCAGTGADVAFVGFGRARPRQCV